MPLLVRVGLKGGGKVERESEESIHFQLEILHYLRRLYISYLFMFVDPFWREEEKGQFTIMIKKKIE